MGKTAQIARMIQQELGGDLEELQAAYTQDSASYLVLSKEIVSSEQSKYHAVKHDPVHTIWSSSAHLCGGLIFLLP